MFYNKDNLGGFPMRNRKRHADLAWTIVTAVFFVAAGALFFTLPMIDSAIGEGPAGAPYDPIALWVEGWDNLISFNFASRQYLIIFSFGCVIVALLLFWLIAIIVKKRPAKLVLWFILAIMCSGAGFVAMAYTLGVCRTVTLVNGAQLKQHVIQDILGVYGVYRLKSAPDAAPYVFNNFLTWILAIVEVGLVALLGLFAFVTGLVAPISLLKKERVRAVKEQPAEEPVEEVDEAELERARREADLISYVEYKAGREAREKEYRELCRANGIPLPEDEVVDDDAYYRETIASLGIFKEQPQVEEDNDEAYYRDTAANLGVLNEQPAEPAPELDPEEEYYDRLTKELMVFKLAKASQDVRLEKYYRDTIAELEMFNPDYDSKTNEAISNLRRDAAKKRAYYQKMIEELPCLHYQKDPVEPEVGNDK